MAFSHQPVLASQVLHWLAPRSPGHYVDATVGGGGHAEAVLEASAPAGRLLGVDRDPDAVASARARLARFGDRAHIVQGRYGQLGELLAAHAFGARRGDRHRVDGLVLDAGVSSPQLDRAERGFSFQQDGPLDMRMSQSGRTCAELLDDLSDGELARVLGRYGEVAHAGALARALKAARAAGRLETTRQLADLVAARARGGRPTRIHPATQVFQALRIAVNEELDDLEALCDALPDLLDADGVAILISFHSLEDRIVKRALRRHGEPPALLAGVPVAEADRPVPPLEVLTPKPVTASDAEVNENPRARSARLRAARRRPLPLQEAA